METRTPKTRRLRSAPTRAGYPQTESESSGVGLWKTLPVPRRRTGFRRAYRPERYLSDSTKLLRSVLKSEFASFSFSTILIEWMTVE